MRKLHLLYIYSRSEYHTIMRAPISQVTNWLYEIFVTETKISINLNFCQHFSEQAIKICCTFCKWPKIYPHDRLLYLAQRVHVQIHVYLHVQIHVLCTWSIPLCTDWCSVCMRCISDLVVSIFVFSVSSSCLRSWNCCISLLISASCCVLLLSTSLYCVLRASICWERRSRRTGRIEEGEGERYWYCIKKIKFIYNINSTEKHLWLYTYICAWKDRKLYMNSLQYIMSYFFFLFLAIHF